MDSAGGRGRWDTHVMPRVVWAVMSVLCLTLAAALLIESYEEYAGVVAAVGAAAAVNVL